MKRLIVTRSHREKIRQAVLAAPEYREGQPEILSITEFDQAVLEAARGRSREMWCSCRRPARLSTGSGTSWCGANTLRSW